jgi:YidC/Oxa1 family membrane protein insertase
MTALVPGPEGISSCEYFVGAEAALVAPSEISPETRYVATRLVLPGGSLAPGEKVERSWRVYGGPKKLEALESYSPSLSAAVDFGWLSALSLPMLHTLEFFHGLVPNWGIAIILLTVLVKLLTLPLTHKQYKSMAGMKVLQPQLKELQEKYKDDRVRLQQEMMGLYKKNGVNPLSGCLPVLLMMPVYIALYKTIYSAVELYQADLAGWITDLSEPDPYFVLPLVLGVFFVIQTRLNPTSGDELQQKLMLWIMPVMFTGMMLFLPSGLVVYILANTLLGILQQLYMNRVTAAAPVAGAAAVGKG